MTYWDSNGHVTDDRHVTQKGQGPDPNVLNAKYLENGWSRDLGPMDHQLEMTH